MDEDILFFFKKLLLKWCETQKLTKIYFKKNNKVSHMLHKNQYHSHILRCMRQSKRVFLSHQNKNIKNKWDNHWSE